MDAVYRGIVVTIKDSGVVSLFGDEDGVHLSEIQDLIGTDTVTVVSLKNNIDMWVDGEGLLKSGNFVNRYTIEDFQIDLAGNAILLGDDGNGGTVGLNEEQVEYLVENLIFGLVGLQDKLSNWGC